ncbi:MAG TPA: T9SS type A sorting domain-containing protein [Chitinophagales bacterium]|nr:T9SS type A sorting domain-containing protein [Chitinophagales bacterium]
MKRNLTLLFIISLLLFLHNSSRAQEWKDVAAIIYDNCSTCHRPGEIGPFSLLSYHDASDPNHVLNIQSYVNSGLMPPWKADPAYTHFLDERVLTQGEKDLISNWVDAGAPAGDTTLAPSPPTFPTGSQLGTPDLVLHVTQPYTKPADDLDHYMCFVLPTNVLQTENVSAFEFRPGNASIVHHAFVYICPDSSAYNEDLLTPEYGYQSFGGVGDGVNANLFTLYGPGMFPRFYPAGGITHLPANSFVVLQIHYAPSAYEATDSSSINIFYSSLPSPRQVHDKIIGEGYITNGPFNILAYEVDTFYSEFPVNSEMSLFSIAPHQHLLGRAYKIFGVTPTQDTIPLISIPQWDFHWQLLYSYPFMVHLPAGTHIHAMAVYDNTTNNPNNPNDPPVNVHYGESSTDEMFKYFINWLEYQSGDESLIIDSTWNIPTPSPPLDGIVSTPQLYSCSPNPASDHVVISYFLPASETVQLFVYDLAGKLVTQPFAPSGIGLQRINLDISKLTQGLYFCTLKTSGGILTKQFIVQH